MKMASLQTHINDMFIATVISTVTHTDATSITNITIAANTSTTTTNTIINY